MHTPNQLPMHETLTDPWTGEPLQALGFRADGRPIWPIMGGSEDAGGDNSGDGDNGGDDSSPGDDNTDDGDDNGDDADDDADDDDSDDDDGDRGEDKRVRKANKEAERYRRALRQTEQRLDEQGQVLSALRKALVGDDGDGDGNDEPDPAQLQQSIDGLQSENRSLRAQLDVYDAAAEHNGNPSALLDSRRFMGELDKLDPTKDGYRKRLGDTIAKAVERDPKLRADQGSSRGGADLGGGSGEGQQRRARGIASAVSRRYGG